MPKMQESSRFYYLVEGRWLNHQDDLAGNKVIVLPKPFARPRGLKLGDEITFTFRPLTDTYFGLIRDGVDSLNWRSYPTYQDTFKIVGLYNDTNNWAFSAYIPASSLRLGFASVTQNQFRYEEYNFVLDSSRQEAEFIQEFKDPLQALGIRLNFLPNNGPAYWAAVDPIQRSSSADLLVFGLLMVVALILAVFLYVMARKRDYAILRALGVPKKQANRQLILPVLLLGELGILLGGFPAWNYALTQAKASLSSLPMPAGVSPSADLSPLFLAGLCAAIFLLLAMFSGLGVIFLAHKPVFELLQGETSQNKGKPKAKRNQRFQPARSFLIFQPGWHAGSPWKRTSGTCREPGRSRCGQKIHAFIFELVCVPSRAAFQAQVLPDPGRCAGLSARLGLGPANHGAQPPGSGAALRYHRGGSRHRAGRSFIIRRGYARWRHRLCLPEDHRQRLEQRLREKQCARGRYCLGQN